MKPRYIFLLFLSAVVLIGIVLPNGVRGALANNLWSISYIKEFFQADPRTFESVSPPATHAHQNLFIARQAIRTGNLAEGIDHILPLVEKSDRIALDAYANILYLQENFAEAIMIWRDLGKTLTLEKVAIDLQGNNSPESSLLVYQSLYSLNPEKYVSSLAVALKNQGNYQEALSVLNDAIQYFPESSQKANWYRYLGDVYREQQAWAEAESAYLRALSLDQQDARAWRNLGLFYKSNARKDYEKAAECFEEYIKLNPDEAYGYILLGQAYESDQSPEKALVAYQIALKLEPGNVEARQSVDRLSGQN